MNLSTRGRYATRAMLELALHYDEAALSTAAIAESQAISARYLQHLLGSLKRAGLVRAEMGPGGGFALALPPSEIKLGAILDVVEGKVALVECVKHESRCVRAPECVTRLIWAEASDLLQQYFHSITLADLLVRCQARDDETLPSGPPTDRLPSRPTSTRRGDSGTGMSPVRQRKRRLERI